MDTSEETATTGNYRLKSIWKRPGHRPYSSISDLTLWPWSWTFTV